MFKPLFFEASDADDYHRDAYEDLAQNIMIGDALKLSIGLTLSKNETNFSFPPGTWCDLFVNSSEVLHGNGCIETY